MREAQRQAVAAIQKAGGTVLYDWQFEGGRFRLKKGTNIISEEVPWWPRWLVDRLGVDCFGHVTHVQIGYAPTPNPDHLDEALANVGRLGRLKEVRLGGQPVADGGLVDQGVICSPARLDATRANSSISSTSERCRAALSGGSIARLGW